MPTDFSFALTGLKALGMAEMKKNRLVDYPK
jgi:hypothetical protein